MMGGQLEFGLQPTSRRATLTVSQLLRVVRETLEVQLDEYWVAGQVSNARLAPSNHFYFTLKDARSAINAVMFNSALRRLRFGVSDGMQIVVRGRVNVYEVRGAIQLYVEEIEPRGIGALQVAFEQLKERLNQEGLFDPAKKREIPLLPRRLGIVTALGGAALRDLLRILLDRYPNLHVIIRPSPVQGAGAALEITRALDDLNADGRAEVLIIARGGGSLEDLWPFNEEIVARAIRRSAAPVVSAIGHEVDYTIADFAADRRAPTPSAAAQLVVPIKAELRQRIDSIDAAMRDRLAQALRRHRHHIVQLAARLRRPESVNNQARQRLDDDSAELAARIQSRVEAARTRVRAMAARLMSPALRRMMLSGRRTELEFLGARLAAGMRAAVTLQKSRLATESRRLDAVSPLRVLDRGYAVVIKPSSGQVLRSASEVENGEELEVRLARGRIRAQVTGRDI